MDFNDVKARIERIYLTLKLKEVDGVSDYLKFSPIPMSIPLTFSTKGDLKVAFGSGTACKKLLTSTVKGISEIRIPKDGSHQSVIFEAEQNEIIVKMTNIISNIANLKDHLKNHLKGINISSQIVEAKVDENKYLQVVIDLNNADKHGYPPKLHRRSKLDPKFGKPSSALLISRTRDSEGSITIYPDGTVSKIGSVATIIDADIVNLQDEFICTFDELVNNALEAWESFLNEYPVE